MFFMNPVLYHWDKRGENPKQTGERVGSYEGSTLDPAKIPPIREIQAYLERSTSLNVDERVLLAAIRAAHDSIENDNRHTNEEEIFEILSAIIEKCKKLSTNKSLFLYKDKNDETVLHQLIVFGDQWQHITEKVLSFAPGLCKIPDENGQFPLVLAANVRAFETLAVLENYDQPKEAWLQYVKEPYRKEIENGCKEEIEKFIKLNPYPNKVEVSCLIAKHDIWQKAYFILKEYIANHKGKEVITLEEIQNFLKCIFKKETNIENLFRDQKGLIYLFILANEPSFCIEYLLNIYSESFDIRLDLLVFLLKDKEFKAYIKEVELSEKIKVLMRLAEFCDVPALEVLNDNLSLEEDLLQVLEIQIRKWGPEKIMIEIMLNLFKDKVKGLIDILQQEPQGLSEKKIAEIVKKIAEAQDLLAPTDENGNTILHVAYSCEARLVTPELLKGIAKSLPMVQDDPEWVHIAIHDPSRVEKALAIPNKKGQMPWQLASCKFADEIQCEVVCPLLEEPSVSNSPRP